MAEFIELKNFQWVYSNLIKISEFMFFKTFHGHWDLLRACV